MACFQSNSKSFPKFYCLLALSAIILGVSTAPDCSYTRQNCQELNSDRGNYTEIYRDDAKRKTTHMCCLEGSKGAAHSKESATSCKATACVPISQSGLDLCEYGIGTRTVNMTTGKKMRFVEAIRDDCVLHNGNSGVEALCCGEDTLDLRLTTLIGVEPHEFPHFARLENSAGDKIDICGATVYNERYVITASHCVVDKPSFGPRPKRKMSIFLDISIEGKKTDNKYGIDDVIIHPNSSLLNKEPGYHPLNYDVAILKLNRDIQFSDRVQALPLAPKNFKPIDYSDTAVILGFGKTDTLATSKKLQKADAYIRNPTTNTGRGSRYYQHKGDTDQLLFLGGYQDGIKSPSPSKGDSGGPAVCRDKSGKAVLCGLTSFGPDNGANCEKYKNEKECFPTAYAKVSYFREWIEKNAGDQSKARVMDQTLYGKIVASDRYPHQVEITSGEKNGKSCGGTLIAKDVVLTAAHCVASDKGVMKQGLMVTRKGKGKGQQEEHARSIKILEGFKKGAQDKKGRRKRIAVFAAEPTWDAPFYKNDLAIVKLEKPINIPENKIPKLSTVEAVAGPATEVAWVTDYRRKGKLAERKFNLLTHAECQTRMDRLKHAGFSIKVDGNIVCGVEEYSGGSKCDRTLGGGVLCEGNTLCGVQAFRLCEFAAPNAFVDVGLNNAWIQKTMKSM